MQMLADFAPINLGLQNVDLKSIATTIGNLVDLSGFSELGFSFQYTISGTTPTVGTAKLQALLFDSLGTTQVSEAIDIATIVSTQAAGSYRVYVAASRWLAPAMQAYPSGGTFTLGKPELIRPAKNVKFQIAVTVAYDQAGTKVASVNLSVARP